MKQEDIEKSIKCLDRIYSAAYVDTDEEGEAFLQNDYNDIRFVLNFVLAHIDGTDINGELLAALKKCSVQFHKYAQLHMTKQPPDMNEAATNQDWGDFCDRVVFNAEKASLTAACDRGECCGKLAQKTPPGFVLAPREPTEEMVNAAINQGARFGVGFIYKVMLAATPSPPQINPAQDEDATQLKFRERSEG